MRFAISSFILVLIPLVSTASPPEVKCPDVNIVRAVGVQDLSSDVWYGWQGKTKSNYGTEQMWTMKLFHIHGDTKEEARHNMTLALESFKSTPKILIADGNEWFCHYTTDKPDIPGKFQPEAYITSPAGIY